MSYAIHPLRALIILVSKAFVYGDKLDVRNIIEELKSYSKTKKGTHFNDQDNDLFEAYLYYILKEIHETRAKINEIEKMKYEQNVSCTRKTKLSEEQLCILESWISDNINNPYPCDFEKKRLEALTGLSRAQLDTWFINYRRRHLKKSQVNAKII